MNLTYISLSITLSILYQHCHWLTSLWCVLFLQPAFGLHAIAGKGKVKKKKETCQLATFSLYPPFPPFSLHQLVQVIITLTAFSVFTLSLNLSSRAARCANQLRGAPPSLQSALLSSAQLASTQGLTGACKRAAAPPLAAKTAIVHRVVSGVTGSLSQGLHTSSLCLLSASGWS